MLSGVVSIAAIPASSTLQSHEQSRAPSLGPGYAVPNPQSVLWTPPTPAMAHRDFGLPYRILSLFPNCSTDSLAEFVNEGSGGETFVGDDPDAVGIGYFFKDGRESVL